MAGQNAGTITYDVTADTSKLKADIAKAEGDVKAAGAASAAPQVEAAASKATEALKKQSAEATTLGDKLRNIKKTYGEQVEVVQGLIGKVVAVGAVAGTFFKIGEAISTHVIENMKTATERVADFTRELDRSDAKSASRATANEIQRINEALSEVYGTWNTIKQTFSFRLLGDDPAVLLEQQKLLTQQLQGYSNRIAKEQRDKRAADEAKLVADLGKLTQDAVRSNMTEEEKIRTEGEDRILAIKEAYNKLSAESALASEQQTADAIVAIKSDINGRLRKIEEDRLAEEERKRKEAEQKGYDEDRLLSTMEEEKQAGLKRIADEQERRREAFEDFNANIAETIRRRKEAEDNAAKDAADQLTAQQAQAAKVLQTWTNAFRQIREESNRAFATDQAASMVQFASQLRIEGMTAAANMNRIEVQGVG